MMFVENIKEAITSIFSNKMRSILTMLGIIIGISSVITITTIGTSIRSTLNSTLNSLGGNSIYCYVDAVYPEDEVDWETWTYPDMDKDDYVTQEALDELLEMYPDEIEGVQASNSLGLATAKRDSDHYANVNLYGVTNGYLVYNKIKLLRGRDITSADCKGAKSVCLISNRMAKYYFGEDKEAMGQTIPFTMSDGTGIDLTVVGIYELKSTSFEDTSVAEKERTTNVFLPYQTVMRMSGNDMPGFNTFQIMINNQCEDSASVLSNVEAFFEEYYADNKEWHMTCQDVASELGMIDTVLNVITVAISLIAAISLIVGGVGVMNIMLVSITERTREIGVRMALGAKQRTIRSQFLIEAVVLCIIGGIIGILLGIFNGVLLGKIAEFFVQNYYSDYADYIVMSVHPSLTAILLSLFFSMLIGIFFGHYPAKKASKMEVIDALRYE